MIKDKMVKLLLVLLLFPCFTNQIDAAGIYRSTNREVNPGDQVSIVVDTGQSDSVFYEFDIVSSNPNVITGTRFVSMEPKSNKITVTVTAKSEGTAHLSIANDKSVANESGARVNIPQNQITINVVKKTQAPSEKDQVSSKPVSEDNTEEQIQKALKDEEKRKEMQKAIKEAEKDLEKKKKEEEKRNLEKKKQELEEKKKTPLLTEIEVLSQSDKMNGESLKKIATKKDVFEYEYTLPRRIDKFEIKPIASKDVKLDFVKVHQLEGDKKEVIIKAESGEIKQEIKLIVKKNNQKFIDKKVKDQNYQVYEDELLDRFMKNYGYEAKKDDKVGKYFSKEKINLQMLIDQDKNVQWVMLDKSLNVKDFVSPVFLKDQIFFVKEAPEDMQGQTLYNEKYQTTQREVLKEFLNIDPELKYSYEYKSWPFDGGELVYGLDENLDEGVYHLDRDRFKSAVVAFDSESSTWKRLAMVSGFGFLGLASTNAANYYKKKRRRV